MDYERPYYEDLDYRPYLLYVVFGVDGSQMEVSRERHRADEFPEGLRVALYRKPKHSEYMDALVGGTFGEVLGSSNPLLYKAIRNTEQWVVIQGEVERDSDLHYLRNVIGCIQSLVEKGAVAVLDYQTILLYAPSEWTSMIFEPSFEPWVHVVILTSKMGDGSIWLHTRGMRKFGRPDVSFEGVPKDRIENACQIINQMIYYGAQGAFFSRPVKLHTRDDSTYVVKPEFVDDMDNFDFNNSYYRVLWSECKQEAP